MGSGAGAIRPRFLVTPGSARSGRWQLGALPCYEAPMLLKRLDTLEVATSDLADAASIYAKNFGFTVTKSADGKSASVKVGDAVIRLASGDAAATAIAAVGEGMFGLWLEADDLEQVVASFVNSGLNAGPIRREAGRRVLAIDPKLANHVPLFIFDWKP